MFKTLSSSLVLLVLIQFSFVARSESLTTSTLKSEATETSGRKWKGEWQMEIAGQDFTQGKDEGTAASFFFKTNFEYRYSSWLKAVARPRFDFYSGRLQERYESDDYKSRLRVTEFIVNVQPVEQFQFHAGAVSEEYLNSPMLVSKRRAWPGVKAIGGESVAWRGHSLKGEIVLQLAVPTSYSLSTEREDKEALPTFAVQSLHFAGKHFDWLEWKAYGGHFTYNNLPSKVAFESRLFGNSVYGDEPAGSRFATGFDGWFGGVEICGCFPSSWIQPVVGLQRIRNSDAADGLADGQMWGIGPRFIMGDTTLDIQYRRFFIEKDASVSTYMTSFIGNTNRIGDDVEFKLDFRAAKFAIVGEWASAVPLRDNAVQQTINSIYLGVETHYAPF